MRALQSLVPDIGELEPEMQALSDDALQAKTGEFRQRLDNGESLDDLLIEAFAVVREAGVAGARPAPLRRAADGRRRPPLRLGGRDEDRRGQDARVDPAGLPQRAERQGHAPRHGQRLPGDPRPRVDGPAAHVAGPDDGPHRAGQPRPGVQARAVRRRHHVRHQQRVRLRLPARQHGAQPGPPGAARPHLRHRRRGRLDPHRRGPHAAHHLGQGRRRRAALLQVRLDRPRPEARRRLRGRRGEAQRRPHRGRHREGRAPARHREPLRRGRPEPRPPAPGRAQGQGAVQARQGLRRLAAAR